MGEKYVIEKGNAAPGEIASPFPVWGNLHYPCTEQFHQIIGTRIAGSEKTIESLLHLKTVIRQIARLERAHWGYLF